jgi:hypothetical protein
MNIALESRNGTMYRRRPPEPRRWMSPMKGVHMNDERVDRRLDSMNRRFDRLEQLIKER